MLTQEIRRKFLKYFKDRGHTVVPSSPVLPYDDPTLLFINAGMNQFKDVFLGKSVRDYTRATSSQKCIRVGGKHNDLENVGHTKRHLTFFEMLGNFSFGDYFKDEAIQFAWEVSTEVYGFDPERIWPTVFRDDDEAFELWTRYVPAERITRFPEKHNFWEMGNTGPCGPCSELLFDRGPHYGDAKNPKEDVEEERYLEFWNLVFMQFNRDESGNMGPLPKPSIDTGAGLERIVALKMDVDSIYDTDVLRDLIAQVEKVAGVKYEGDPAFRVIADHLRSLAFAIADGVQPSNVERGYVLRKVLRRAVRYGRMLGMEEPFLAKIFPRLIVTMGEDYPEIKKAQSRIEEILTAEEEAFLRTLRRGGNILNQIIEHAQTDKRQITGEEAFKLKDTYGFPLEEILLLAKDAELTVNTKQYHNLEEEARERSRKAHKAARQVAEESLFKELGTCEFLGYTETSGQGKVTAIVVDGAFVDMLEEGAEGMIILDRSPFYAEKGGQIGDTGMLKSETQLFHVTDCQPPYKGVIAHIGKMEKGNLHVGDPIIASIDTERRQKIANNHTATHLLNWALQKVLGEHIKQAGSVVEPSRLRFDFSHHKAATTKEIRQIEDLINSKIRDNLPVKWYELSYEEAQQKPEIKQFFGEKYDSVVRVIDIDYSKELCGGTHTSAVGNIGLFRIAKEGSIAAGIRRIEAVTGEEAEALSREIEEMVEEIAKKLKTQPQKLTTRIENLIEENKQLTQQLKQAKKGEMGDLVKSLVSQVETVNDTPIIAQHVSIPPKELRECAELVLSGIKSGVVALGATTDDKANILVRVSEDLIGKGIKAGEIIKAIAPIINGRGGGKANSAQAGGKAPDKIKDALDKIKELI